MHTEDLPLLGLLLSNASLRLQSLVSALLVAMHWLLTLPGSPFFLYPPLTTLLMSPSPDLQDAVTIQHHLHWGKSICQGI